MTDVLYFFIKCKRCGNEVIISDIDTKLLWLIQFLLVNLLIYRYCRIEPVILLNHIVIWTLDYPLLSDFDELYLAYIKLPGTISGGYTDEYRFAYFQRPCF